MKARLLARLAGVAIRLLRASLRVRILHGERAIAVREGAQPVLVALWHGRMFLPILTHCGEGIVTMASRSEDGEIIALWLENNGYAVTRGSSSRGGATALLAMVRELGTRRVGALTVDGPRGPARVVQPGVVQLARRAGACIVPMSYSSERPKFFRSWDRFLLPRPFSRNVVIYGEPLTIPAETGDEEACAQIAAALDAATAEADAACGIEPPG
jgi:lysophospholipid acyltransferase (LPLAT)-like uncharacterized protein